MIGIYSFFKSSLHCFRIGILFIFMTSSSCSVLFWKNTSMLLEPSWSENGKSFAALEILYKEKNSFNPLNGTTLKKNYKAKIRFYKFSPDQSVKQTWETQTFDSWILPSSLYFHEKTNRIFFLKGTNDEYGTLERDLYFLEFGKKIPQMIPVKKNSNEAILFAIPSPDGEKLAIGIASYSEQNLKDAKIQLFSLNGSEHTIKEIGYWSEFSPEFLITWSVDSASIYIKQFDKVRMISVDNRITSPAKQFPLCFVGTLFGVDFSREGYGVVWDGDGKNYKIQSGKEKSLPNMEMTDKAEKISACH